MPSTERPFFVVSSPRSGSTLLRLILDAHPRLAVPPPSWLFEMIYPYLYSYGDVTAYESFHALAEDILATPTIKKWSVEWTVEELIAAAPAHSFVGLYDAIHRLYAERAGKPRWGEKSPRDCFWMDEIKEAFPKVQFVHIVRDGRDMAIDIADSALWPYTLIAGARLWEAYVQAVRDSAQRLDRDSFFEIRYEDLCAAPERVVRDVCAFLDEEFVDRMLRHHEARSAQTWGSDRLHAKIARPITTEYCELYKRRLPPGDVAAIQGEISETLQLFGYELQGPVEPVSARLAAQMVNNDTVTNPANVDWKRWYMERRRERRERGVWRDSDRDSLLWGTT